VQNTEKSRVRHNSPCSATILGQSNVEDFHGEGSGLTHAAAGTADGKEEICRIREAASLQAQRAGAPSRRVRVKAVTNTRTRGCEGQTFKRQIDATGEANTAGDGHRDRLRRVAWEE
jgi:hypothetical protein